MKKLVLTSAFLGALALTGKAQQSETTPDKNTVTANEATVKKAPRELTPEQAAQRQSTKAADELGLNAEQKQKYYDYSLTRITANRPLKQQAQAATDKTAKKSAHQKIKANRAAFDKNVKAMLSPEQVTKWEARNANAKAGKETSDADQD